MPAQYNAPAWGGSLYHDLNVPSGGKIQVKKVDLEDLVKADLVDEFDTLAGVAEEKVVGPAKGKRPQDRQKKKPTKAQHAAQQANLSRDSLPVLTSLMRRLLPLLIIQPKVASTYIKDEAGKWVELDPEDREEGVIYIDTVPFVDQMYILEFCMDGMDADGLQQFREQRSEDLGVVEPQPAPEDAPE